MHSLRNYHSFSSRNCSYQDCAYCNSLEKVLNLATQIISKYRPWRLLCFSLTILLIINVAIDTTYSNKLTPFLLPQTAKKQFASFIRSFLRSDRTDRSLSSLWQMKSLEFPACAELLIDDDLVVATSAPFWQIEILWFYTPAFVLQLSLSYKV